jgi:hypothetical protein
MNILTLKGYFERFYQLRKDYKTHKQTWEALEDELYSKYNINSYSSFESFERSFYRYTNFYFNQV